MRIRGRITCGAVLVIALAALAGCGGDGSYGRPAARGPVTPPASAAPVTAKPDHLEVGSGTTNKSFEAQGLKATVMPLGTVLAGPHFAVWIDAVAVSSELLFRVRDAYKLTSERANAPLRAAPGREFLLARVHEDDSMAWVSPPTAPLTATITVDGVARPLDTGVPATGSVIVVSVPVGGDALLSVSDEGRTQTISLRTGQRPQLIPLFHPVLGNQARLEDTVHIPAVHKATEAYSYQATVSVALRPWVEGAGWAPAGRAWLVVTFGVRIGPKADLALDLPRSLSLRRGDGAGVPIPAGTVLRVKGSSGSSETWKGTFDVPVSLRSVTATFRTNGTVTNPGSGATLSFTRADDDNTRAMKLEPQLEQTR